VTPTALRLLALWARIGIQSFGGGQSVLLYAYAAIVDRYHWYTPEAWSEDWALCQLAPGVNLIAFAALIGSRLVGRVGIVVSLVGLLVPSIAITVLMAALYLRIRDIKIVQGAVHGMLFGAVGGSVVNAIRLARPLLTASLRDGATVLIIAILAIPTCAIVASSGHLPIVVLLVAAGSVMSATVWASRRGRAEAAP
jgi:chromate transporter